MNKTANQKIYQEFKFKVRALLKATELAKMYGMGQHKLLHLKASHFPVSYALIAEADKHFEFIEELKRSDL